MNYWTYFLNVSLPSWHLHELNLIISEAEQSRGIQTIAFFGYENEVDRYLRAAEDRSIPKLVKTQNYGGLNYKDVVGINNNVFFVAIGSLDQMAMWRHINEAFYDMQNHVRGVFITTRSKSNGFNRMLEEHFKWCWQRGFTNILILVDNEQDSVRKFDMFTYSPFQEEKVLSLTAEQNVSLFSDKFRNFHGYGIRTCALHDPPRVFARQQCRAKKDTGLSGYVARILQAFVREYNAGITLIYDLSNATYNIHTIIQLLHRGDIELTINPYVPQKNIQLSYPIYMLQRCVVVPFANELPRYQYFILPFQNEVWVFFLGMWLLMSLSRFFSTLITHRRCHCRLFDVSKIFLDVWRQIMYLPAPSISCGKALHWFNVLWFISVFAFSFILSNLYLATLTSFLAGFVFEQQISSLAELVERHVQIETLESDIPIILENRGLPRGFTDLLIPRSFSELHQDILSLRPGITYAALHDHIRFALIQQEHLLKPFSHIVPECIATAPLGFMMQPTSQFEIPLNRFILRAVAAGLIDKWFADSIQDAICSGILQMRKPQFQVTAALTLEHFQFGWFVLLDGYIASFILFLVENLQRITRRFRIFLVYY